MTANTLPQVALPLVMSVIQWWQALVARTNLPRRYHSASFWPPSLRVRWWHSTFKSFLANRAAASTALYMDSVVVPLVQELAANLLYLHRIAALSTSDVACIFREAVVAFRIWVADRIVFSSRGELVGKQFSSTPARNHAFEGNVVASLGLDGDDEDAERALRVPILEIYAPVRQTSTNNIIALAETSELAVDLMKEIRTAQYTSFAVLGSGAIGLILVLFGSNGACNGKSPNWHGSSCRRSCSANGSAAPTACPGDQREKFTPRRRGAGRRPVAAHRLRAAEARRFARGSTQARRRSWSHQCGPA